MVILVVVATVLTDVPALQAEAVIVKGFMRSQLARGWRLE